MMLCSGASVGCSLLSVVWGLGAGEGVLKLSQGWRYFVKGSWENNICKEICVAFSMTWELSTAFGEDLLIKLVLPTSHVTPATQSRSILGRVYLQASLVTLCMQP